MRRLSPLIFIGLAFFAWPVSAEPLAPEAARRLVENAVAGIVDALGRGDFKRLASFVGEEGLVVSPYVTLDPDDVRLSRAGIMSCAEGARVRLWGHKDGSGDPIKMTCRQYFTHFVWDVDYAQPDEILYNEPRQRGNELNNNHDLVPDVIVVELHVRKSPEGVQPHRPWKSLRLVFRGSDQGVTLIAITRDVWTI